jgi:hypothetical protein
VADYTPVHTGGAQPFTSQVSGADIVGGTFVSVSGVNTVATSGAASATVIGVAAHDSAVGKKITVWPLRNVTHEIASTGTVTAGDGVVTGAAGVAATAVVGTAAAAGTLVGIAESTATGGALVRFLGR